MCWRAGPCTRSALRDRDGVARVGDRRPDQRLLLLPGRAGGGKTAPTDSISCSLLYHGERKSKDIRTAHHSDRFYTSLDASWLHLIRKVSVSFITLQLVTLPRISLFNKAPEWIQASPPPSGTGASGLYRGNVPYIPGGCLSASVFPTYYYHWSSRIPLANR